MPVYKDTERGTWFFEFRKVIRGKSVKRKGRGFKTKLEAQKAERDAFEQLENPTSIKDAINYTLDELYELYVEYRKNKIKITTINGDNEKYKNHIGSVLGSTLASSLTNDMLFNWKKDLVAKNMSEKFTNQIIHVFKGLVNFGIKKGAIINLKLTDELDKVIMHKIVPEREIWTYEETNKFLATFNLELPEEKDYYEYFYAYSRSGMRPNEFRALTVADIQGDHLVVNKNITSKITGAGDIIQTPKNKSSNRKVIMPPEIVSLLLERTKDYNPSDYIFGKEKAFRETNLNRQLKRHAKAAGLKPIVLYGFRHSHATHLIRNGVPIKVVSKRLGHKDVSTTMNVYWHLFSEDESLALEVLK